MKLSDDQVEKKVIGEIVFEALAKYRCKKMKETLLNGRFELISISGRPLSLISLPNGNFVCGTDDSVKLLDENFKEIKSVLTVRQNYCALNHRKEIYVSDHYKSCIILFDSNLNQLKQFGSQGAGNNQFNHPQGLCCHEDYFYICDCNNKRIQILTLDFEYVNTIQLDGNHPFRVQTSETTICVSCSTSVLFFDLKTRALKHKSNFGIFNTNYIDSIFYASNFLKKKCYFYDSDGNFIEEMPFNENISKHITFYDSGSLCRNKNNLYMADSMSSKILKFIE